MKKVLFLFVASLLLLSCKVAKPLPLTSTNSIPVEVKSSLSKDKVWDKIIDMFAQEGHVIKIIDKSSGLITTDEYSFISEYTIEDQKGTQKNPNAYIVVKQQCKRCGVPGTITGQWNVRVKESEDGGCTINVNVVNLKAYDTYYDKKTGKTSYYNYFVGTNHIFEKELAEKFK